MFSLRNGLKHSATLSCYTKMTNVDYVYIKLEKRIAYMIFKS